MFLYEFVHALYLAKLPSLSKCDYNITYILPRATHRGKFNLCLMVTYPHAYSSKKEKPPKAAILKAYRLKFQYKSSITAIQARTRLCSQKRSPHGQQAQLCLLMLVQMQTSLNLKHCPNRRVPFVLVPFGQVQKC